MRLMLPLQTVAFPCPQTGRRLSGTIEKIVIRQGTPVYRIDVGGIVHEAAPSNVIPVSCRRPAEREHVLMGVKGGQGRTGAELVRAAAIPEALGMIAVFLIGIGLGELIVRAATWIGATYLS